ncbi:MAG: flagellar hook capping FlgD N-terminal domain-containing protein, partial [Planctomycetota bacterium]
MIDGISVGEATQSLATAQGSQTLDKDAFTQLLVTQLQNQDPTEPAKNEQLLAQMSQIGQLQSSTELQKSLETMTLQSNLGAAG